MTYKTIILSLFFLLFLGNDVAAQESSRMRIAGDQVVYEGSPITVGNAKQLARGKSTEAYNNFRLAQRVNAWNIVWSVVGGYELGAGFVQAVVVGNPLGFLDMALGGVLVAIPYFDGRKTKRAMFIKQGVIAYNNSL